MTSKPASTPPVNGSSSATTDAVTPLAETPMSFEEWSRGMPEVTRRLATDEEYRKQITKRIS